MIEHGFRLNLFEEVDEERKISMREKYGLPDRKKVVGVISRYIELKGVDYIIQAFRKVQMRLPDTHLILANAGGPYEGFFKAPVEFTGTIFGGVPPYDCL